MFQTATFVFPVPLKTIIRMTGTMEMIKRDCRDLNCAQRAQNGLQRKQQRQEGGNSTQGGRPAVSEPI